MSARFRIYKDDDPVEPWIVDYPQGFDDTWDGKSFATFDEAVAEFIDRQSEQCPTCQKGGVIDVDWGWKCTNCGAYDVAVGHSRPAEATA